MTPTPLVTVWLVSGHRRSATALDKSRTRCFGEILTPVHYRRRIARLVSCYALFKWWLLLSQHPSCHSNSTSLVTKYFFGTLAGDLGCFPLDPGAYPPGTHCRDNFIGIRSLVQWGTPGRAPIRFSLSTPDE
jgi:hypothetical protein